MDGCSDGGKGSGRVVNSGEEEENILYYHGKNFEIINSKVHDWLNRFLFHD